MYYNKKNVRVLIMDVDGTLTDGKIHISAQGELFKSFDVKDGYSISITLPQHKIIPVIITGRTSTIVEHRAKELGIKYLYQGIKDKRECVQMVSSELGIPLEQMACIGDDLNDLVMMELCGVRGCPSNAVNEVKKIADYIAASEGGRGAVREFVDWLTDVTCDK